MTTFRIIELAVASLLVVVAALAVRTIAVYAAIFSLIQGPKRQLPAHVWTIVSSYLFLVLLVLYLLVDAGAQHRVPVLLAGGFAATFGLWAMVNILRYENRKYTEVSNFTDLSDPHIHNFGSPAKAPRPGDRPRA